MHGDPIKLITVAGWKQELLIKLQRLQAELASVDRSGAWPHEVDTIITNLIATIGEQLGHYAEHGLPIVSRAAKVRGDGLAILRVQAAAAAAVRDHIRNDTMLEPAGCTHADLGLAPYAEVFALLTDQLERLVATVETGMEAA